ncbi:MAG: ectonucleotide pyrophosphatase/phosphodiesterase [Candidatus Kapabacteria bacterium]|jgi:ectonucleotide pyrophosphatase/phosphodiesterase family protein 5|nr:ectonucleotide pyrophosphatase/phosphodiesterase [Candidatus Kapabacteria bacterium]
MNLNRFLLFGLILFCVFVSGLKAESPKRETLILISFDGFRWDYTGRDSLDNFDKFCNEGVKAHSLQPVFPTTSYPNHLSIVTGLHPENHGIIANRFRDPFTNNCFTIRDEDAVTDPKWYQGEAFWETAKRQGILSASCFWPGSELEADHRRPEITEEYDKDVSSSERIEKLIEWLKLPEGERPQFISICLSETDFEGHKYGTEGDETDKAIRRSDKLLGTLIDSLQSMGIYDAVDIVIVSDQGMTDVLSDSLIIVESIINTQDCYMQNYGSYMAISAPDSSLRSIYNALKANRKHYNVYLKDEIPEYLHYTRHPFIAPIFVLAQPGFVFVVDSSAYKLDMLKGAHGYDHTCTDMHGIFLARGPSFQQGYECGTLYNIDIYPLLCELFGIKGRQHIDGKIERIKFILKKN